MSTSKKIWLGILTFLPFIFFISYFVLFFTVFIGNIHQLEQTHHGDEFPLELIQSLFLVFIPIIIASILSLAIMIYYIVHANNNPNNDSGKKIMWIIILIFVSSIGCVVYYFVEILPSKPKFSETKSLDDQTRT